MVFSKFLRTFALISTLIIISAFFSACANQSPELEDEEVTLTQKLNAVPMSAVLRLNSSIQSCDLLAGEKFLKNRISTDIRKSGDLWDSCQNLYACTPETRTMVKGFFAHGEIFNLGFANIRSLGVTHSKWQPHGLYRVGTENVYLDTGIENGLQACAVLLHELVHRFDPHAQNGEKSVRTEYRAYYYQRYFMGELGMIPGSFQKEVIRAKIQIDGSRYKAYTRPQLVRSVGHIVGQKPNNDEVKKLVKKYPPLPWERRFRKETSIKIQTPKRIESDKSSSVRR